MPLFFANHQARVNFQKSEPVSEQSRYLHTLTSSTLNWSDYILFTTKLLETTLANSKEVNSALQDVKLKYLHGQKEQAIKAILTISQEHKEIAENETLLACIQSKAKSLLDDPMALDSRRYFETIFSHALWKTWGEREFAMLTKLSTLITELVDPAVLEALSKRVPPKLLPKTVTSYAEAELVIDIMEECERNKTVEMRIEDIKAQSLVSRIKDRDTTTEKSKSFKVLSCNPGIMKSMACNPADNLVDVAVNRLVDIGVIKQSVNNGFSRSNGSIPFVNSVSGHSFVLLAVIERFMSQYENESQEKRQSAIDDLIKVFIAFTAKRGFHSLGEMLAVLNDPAADALFSALAIERNYVFSNEVINDSFRKACDYAYSLHLKREVNKEIQSLAIRECTSINDLLNYTNKGGCYVFLDLDNTVIRPSDKSVLGHDQGDLGSDQWFEALVRHAISVIPDRNAAFNIALCLRNAVHKHIQIDFVEADVVALINKLQQELKIPVIALTSRGPSILATTEKEFNELGVNFFVANADTQYAFDSLKTEHQTPVYHNGIIYCDGINKGTVLRNFLKQMCTLGVQPHQIVMVDDTRQNLVNVKEGIEDLPVQYVCLRYGYLDEKIAQFSMEKANQMLLKMMPKFSEDEKAAVEMLKILPATPVKSNVNALRLFSTKSESEKSAGGSNSERSAELKVMG